MQDNLQTQGSLGHAEHDRQDLERCPDPPQDRLRENLHVAIAAARGRREALDHVLLYGPPGLGKTTLAYVIGNEMGVPVRATAGPVIERPGDLAGMLTDLQEHAVLFIDEIHRMAPAIEEILYPAMEDYELDIVIAGFAGRIDALRDVSNGCSGDAADQSGDQPLGDGSRSLSGHVMFSYAVVF